jgi:hypothetical protein
MNLVIVFLGFALWLSAQTSPEQAIKELKEHTLIVNLIYPDRQIEALLKSNQKEKAKELELEAKIENDALIMAFKEHYKFGKCLFIYNTGISAMMDGDASVLFDVNGIKQTSIPEIYYWSEINLTPEKSQRGLLILDRHRDILTKPFPYFVSQWDFLHIKKLPVPEMVKQLDKNLSSYYNKVKAKDQ